MLPWYLIFLSLWTLNHFIYHKIFSPSLYLHQDYLCMWFYVDCYLCLYCVLCICWVFLSISHQNVYFLFSWMPSQVLCVSGYVGSIIFLLLDANLLLCLYCWLWQYFSNRPWGKILQWHKAIVVVILFWPFWQYWNLCPKWSFVECMMSFASIKLPCILVCLQAC